MKINEGYPGDLLSKRRQKFREQIEQKNRQIVGGWCLFWFILFVIIACALILGYYYGIH